MFPRDRVIELVTRLCPKHSHHLPALLFAMSTAAVIFGLYLTGENISSLILILVSVATVWIIIREHSLRRSEIFRKVEVILHELEIGKNVCNAWTADNYPALYSPQSSSVSILFNIVLNGLLPS